MNTKSDRSLSIEHSAIYFEAGDNHCQVVINNARTSFYIRSNLSWVQSELSNIFYKYSENDEIYVFIFVVSYYSNNDLRHISVFASPALSRRRRNVYVNQDKFWMLREGASKENPEKIEKITKLQQQVYEYFKHLASVSNNFRLMYSSH